MTTKASRLNRPIQKAIAVGDEIEEGRVTRIETHQNGSQTIHFINKQNFAGNKTISPKSQN